VAAHRLNSILVPYRRQAVRLLLPYMLHFSWHCGLCLSSSCVASEGSTCWVGVKQAKVQTGLPFFSGLRGGERREGAIVTCLGAAAGST